jgi:2-deoxy-D-gluconate 3-dehydrogenase
MSLPNLFDLSGHVAVVTGGNGGMGRSMALGLAQAGAAVAVLARNEEKNQRVLGELKTLGNPASALRVDVMSLYGGNYQPALEQVERTLGPVSILVNNAGIAAFGGVLEQAPEDWDRVIETNLTACFLISKLAAASMVKQRRGKSSTSLAVCLLRRRISSLLQRRQRGVGAAYQIDRDRTGALQHPGERPHARIY